MVAPARAFAPFAGRSGSRLRSFGRPLKDGRLAKQMNLDGVRAGLAGADADGFLDIEDENLAVADAARARSLLDGLDRGFQPVLIDHDFDLHLGQEVHDIFSP